MEKGRITILSYCHYYNIPFVSQLSRSWSSQMVLSYTHWDMLNYGVVGFPLDDDPNRKSQEDKNTIGVGILMSIVLET